VVLQAEHHQAAWQRLQAVQLAMDEVAKLAGKAYGLGELTLTEALQARRTALEAALAADAARWDALEALARVLVDAHQLWAADEHTAR
jgi:outer membrane protein TolC